MIYSDLSLDPVQHNLLSILDNFVSGELWQLPGTMEE